MSEKFKVKVAALVAEGHTYYRRGGLVLTRDQQDAEVDLDQLQVLKGDPRCVVVGGPDIMPKPAPAKPDSPDAKIQMLGESRDAAQNRAEQAEAELKQAKAKLLKLEHQLKQADDAKKGK